MSIVRTEQKSTTIRYHLHQRDILLALEAQHGIVFTPATTISRPDLKGQFVVETTYESSAELPAPLRGGAEPLPPYTSGANADPNTGPQQP